MGPGVRIRLFHILHFVRDLLFPLLKNSKSGVDDRADRLRITHTHRQTLLVHPISTMWKRVWSTWSHKICILISVKHFSPTNVCVMTFTETDLSQTSNSSRSWTQEAVNMAAPCWKLLWDWYVRGFKLVEDEEWAKINVKVPGTSSLPQFEKKNKLKEWKEI